MAEHPKVREGKNPNKTPLEELTEKDLLVAIYRAVATIRTIAVIAFLFFLLAFVVALAGGSGT